MTSHLRTYSGQWQYLRMPQPKESTRSVTPTLTTPGRTHNKKNLLSFATSNLRSRQHHPHFRVQCTFNRGNALLFEATAVLVHTVVSSYFPCSIVHLYCLFVCFSCCIASSQPNCFHQFVNSFFCTYKPTIIFSAFFCIPISARYIARKKKKNKIKNKRKTNSPPPLTPFLPQIPL